MKNTPMANCRTGQMFFVVVVVTFQVESIQFSAALSHWLETAHKRLSISNVNFV